MKIKKFNYDNNMVSTFLYATSLIGLTTSSVLFYPEITEFFFEKQNFAFSKAGIIHQKRAHTFHTSVVIFGLASNSFFCGTYSFHPFIKLLKSFTQNNRNN